MPESILSILNPLMNKEKTLSYFQNLQEMDNSTAFGMHARDNAFQVRKTFRNFCKSRLEGWMFENILNRVQPGVDGGNFSQWHAEPDSEETFSERCHATTKEPQQGPLLSTFVI